MKKNNSHHANRRREQASKSVIMPTRNREWGQAVLDQGARNNTMPSGKAYRRPSPGKRWE